MSKRAFKFSSRIFHRDIARAFNSWLAARFGGGALEPERLREFIRRLRSRCAA